jgi:hypothetical protein
LASSLPEKPGGYKAAAKMRAFDGRRQPRKGGWTEIHGICGKAVTILPDFRENSAQMKATQNVYLCRSFLTFIAMPKKAKRTPASVLKQLAASALLIIVSVWLALFLDGIREQQKVTADITAAFRGIRLELESHRDSLVFLTEHHRQCLAALERTQENNHAALAGSIRLPALDAAAWNTLLHTGLATHLKFEDAYPFTRLYALQQDGVERVSAELDQQIRHAAEASASGKTFKILLENLYEAEKRLLAETETVLKAGQNWRYLE